VTRQRLRSALHLPTNDATQIADEECALIRRWFEVDAPAKKLDGSSLSMPQYEVPIVVMREQWQPRFMTLVTASAAFLQCSVRRYLDARPFAERVLGMAQALLGPTEEAISCQQRPR
jgi:hypothetical protein